MTIFVNFTFFTNYSFLQLKTLITSIVKKFVKNDHFSKLQVILYILYFLYFIIYIFYK